MKVYFACSIKGGGDTSNYQVIIESIKASGSEVLSEVFVNDAISYGGSPLPADQIYQRDINWIREADIIVAEVTNPSLGVGYELSYAEQLQKPILTLFHSKSDRKLSAMIAGNSYFENKIYSSSSDILNLVALFMNKH